MAVAAYAKKIVQAETDAKEMIDHTFLAGFLHDIGKLVLVTSMQEQYLEATVLAQEKHITLCQAECQLLTATHGDVGGYLLGLWGLPGAAVETSAFHHRLDTYPNPSFCPALAVHVADVIYYMINPDQQTFGPLQANMAYLEKAGVERRFDHWLELCRTVEL